MQRLPASPRPESYELDLHVDPAANGYRGSVEIALALARKTRQIELHAVDLELEHCEVADGRGAARVRRVSPRPARETVVLALDREIELHAVDLELEHCEVADGRGSARVRRVSPRPARETVVLALEREVGPGRATLRIRFAGPLRTDLRGLYLAASGGRRYAVTQLEAAAARRFFPCFDEPDRKARFRLTVATPARNEVVSNAPVESTQTRGGEKVVRFAQTPKLSSYLVALVVGELAASPVRLCGKTPIRVWHVPEKSGLADFALEAAVESLARLERYFALPYPYAKLDLLAVPDFEFGAMENAGAVVFRETLLLLDPKTATLRERKRVAEVIAHELAHMWYGDLVTMAWWDDLWLNEAFATWMAFTIVDQWKPEWKMWLDFEQHRAGALAADALKNTHPVYVAVNTPDEATENFDVITYEKGAAVVRMLERWLGPATFRRGVRRYIRRHRESNATAADLWRALAEAAGKPVAPVVRAWIERPGFPLVSVQRTDRDGRARLDLAQERFFASPREPAKARRARWPIPLVVRVAPPRGNTRVVRDLVRGARGRLDLGPSGRVAFAYANAEESGFIRPLHAGPLLATIASELARLEPSERMGLASHQWAGLRANRAPLGDFLALVQPLADEREPDVLESLVGPLATLDDLVAPAAGPEAVAALRLRVAARFLPRFRALGWDSAPGEEDAARLRRAVLLRIAGGIAHAPELESEAARRVEAYLRDRGSLDPNLATPTVELAARGGDARLWETYRKTFEEARIPQERTRFEMALASFTRPELVARTLELALGESVPTQDVVPLLGRLLENPAAREATWRFVRERWDALQPRVPSGLASRLVAALPLLQTREHRAEVVAFFKAHPLPTAKRALRQALERFDLNAEFARRAAPALAQWLELSTPGSALEPRARGRGRGR